MGKRQTNKKYKIYYYDIDYKKRATPTAIMNYFGDIAVQHSSDAGMNLDYMNENKIAWVLYKWDIDIERYPIMDEEIEVSTTAYSFRKFYGYRKYTIKDSAGKTIITANSVWFLINTEKRRLMRIPQIMYDAFGITEDDNTELKIKDIDELTGISSEKDFYVRYSDIDTNMHVNNVKYMAWILETVPFSIIKEYTLKNIIMTYEKETTYGEMIKVQTEIIEDGNQIICRHKIMDKEGKKLNIANTVWIKE